MNERSKMYALLFCVLEMAVALTICSTLQDRIMLTSMKPTSENVLSNDILKRWKNVSVSSNFTLAKRDSWANPFTRQREHELRQIFMQIKSYISRMTFDVDAFLSNRDSLSKRLLNTHRLLRSSITSNKTWQRYQFVSRTLEIMSSTAESLKRYSKMNIPGSRLLYKVVEIKARAFALYNLNGVPAINDDYFGEKVLALVNELYAWERRLYGLSSVPVDVVQDFKNQFNTAENMLLVLRSYSVKKILTSIEEDE